MWISDYMTKNSVKPNENLGAQIVGSKKDTVSAVGSSLKSSARLTAPYGYAAVPPSGESAVIVTASGGEYCVGVKSKTDGLQSGEVRITSAGGACIELKNDGKVYINGKAVG